MKLLWCILCLNHVLALNKDWWKHSTMYEIFTPSYKDNNGDGWGDLKGIASKLDYLKNLGIDTIYLTPYHPSPMLDMGYDVADYYAIHPSLGTMADFDELINQLKKRDMKLIMDLVINHSSNQHQWFKKSIARVEPYTDYYVWRDPKGYDNNSHPIEPNNWCNIGIKSAWTWNEKRNQFYYHVFLPEQPDLNYRNPRVVREMKKIIKFWLNKGVAGMRLDAVPWIMEDSSFEDEEPINAENKGKKVGCLELKREKTMNIKDTFSFLRKIRFYVDEISAKANTLERIIILEAFGNEEQLKEYYGYYSYPSCHYVFNTIFVQQFNYWSPSIINSSINFWMYITPNTSAPNWQLGNHDSLRVSFKFIQEYVNVFFTLISTLPGIMVLYYGEEIGMTLGVVRPHQRGSFFNEFHRTPMQWDKSLSGGFSSNSKTWLPVNPNYWRINVKEQQSKSDSVYNFIKSLLTLRKTDTFMYGDFEKIILSDWVLVIKRSYKDKMYFVVLNLATEREKIHLDSHLPLAPEITALKVQLSTANSKLKKGALVVKKKKRSFMMQPMSSVVLSVEENIYSFGSEHEQRDQAKE
ncbi:hypothetical protein V9T40_009713 [Parthenolecanium corni]|uniref:alpha-glucosidase n=1 Tax=Parthenolecanium corni TaxID=536013 RepID=A0AAN9TP08_9HEMI